MKAPIRSKLSTLINNPIRLFAFVASKGLFNWMPDKQYLKQMYRSMTGDRLNLSNPITFNEKIQWLKLYDRNPLFVKCADKYMVREHISDLLGRRYLSKIYGTFNNFDEINFDNLPESFVIKCTHDSGGVVICSDKSSFSIEEARDKINRNLKKNFYFFGREWVYKKISPRIICEEYLVDESGTELKDYKIFCFNGEPKIIQVDFNRFENHKRNIYTIDWEFIDLQIEFPNDPTTILTKPDTLEEMLNSASILSSGIKHVRIDLYSVSGKIIFGEMTFYHGSGYEKFYPEKYNHLFGEWIALNK